MPQSPRRSAVLSALIGAALLAGCAQPDRADHHHPAEPRGAVVSSASGTVAYARETDYAASHTLADDGAGAWLGGTTGLIIGSTIGQGAGRAAGAAIGLLTGMFVGAAIENEIERHLATEYLIDLDDGETVTVIVPGRARFLPGDAVVVRIYSDGMAALFPRPLCPGGDCTVRGLEPNPRAYN